MDQTGITTNPYAPPQAAVRDIADRHASNTAAERGTRLGASVLDAVIGMTMMYLPIVLAAFIASAGDRSAGVIVVAVLVGLSGFTVWSYLTYINVKRTGQSLGKKMLGIRVVRVDGSPATVGRIFWLRNVLNGLFSAVPILGTLYGLIDALFIFSESRQCLHDRLADTIVVKA